MAITHGGNLFAVARARGWDWHEGLDFSSSINPLGPAKGVMPAIRQALDRIVHYPEPEPVLLRQALAAKWGVRAEQVLVGNGATDLIEFAGRVFADTPVTLALPVFAEFHRVFPHAASALSWPNKGLLVLTRPANPTGCTMGLGAVREWLRATGAHLLVDESFLDFSDAESAISLIGEFPRVLVLRSLTKFYALPGLRVGALVGSVEAMQSLRRLRVPWQVNVLAEAAALAAIEDAEHAARSREFVRSERRWLARELKVVETDANFLYVPLPFPAAPLCEHLLAHKILVRDCSGWPGLEGEAVRVAVRSREENERLLAAWREFACG